MYSQQIEEIRERVLQQIQPKIEALQREAENAKSALEAEKRARAEAEAMLAKLKASISGQGFARGMGNMPNREELKSVALARIEMADWLEVCDLDRQAKGLSEIAYYGGSKEKTLEAKKQ